MKFETLLKNSLVIMCIYVLDGINDLNPQTIRKIKTNLEKLFQ